MDAAPARTEAVRFALKSVAWSLGFFGLLRLNWTEAHAVLPVTRAQAAAAVGLFGTSALPLQVTLACSGADALALCLGSILAYPVKWRTRLAAALGGAVLILALNTVRIGTLGLVVGSPAWFNTLHVYVWPAILTTAIAGYVFGWMRLANGVGDPALLGRLTPTRRFVVFTVGFLILFTAASPLYLESPRVFALAGFIARAAAALLGLVGVDAHASANVLWTPRGGFLVTQECISTPLIPVYLAAVCAQGLPWRRLILGVLAAAPLFVALGIARLLVVALPLAVVASPLFLVHTFYQLLLGGVLVFLAARWRYGRVAPLQTMVGLGAGLAFVYLLGGPYTRILLNLAGTPLTDPQAAIRFVPAFQIGLYIALWIAAFVAVGWRPFLAGFAVLALTQTAGLFLLRVLTSHTGLTAHVRDVRGWAVAGPVLVVAVVVNLARPRR